MQNLDKSRLSLGERLVIALDNPDLDTAKRLVDELHDTGAVFKIGYHSLFSGGLDFARDLARQGVKVFLDAKLFDIPKTVEGGTRALAADGFWCMTAHAVAQNIAGAVAGAADSDLKIFGVTVLTSMTDQDLQADGIGRTVDDQVMNRAGEALGAGAHGLISSPHEAQNLRNRFGLQPLIVTPGVRPSGADHGDQARVMTPGEAIKRGADALVMGRPIIQAVSPLDAARRALDEINDAL